MTRHNGDVIPPSSEATRSGGEDGGEIRNLPNPLKRRKTKKELLENLEADKIELVESVKIANRLLEEGKANLSGLCNFEKVYNYSGQELSPEETSVLELGPDFTLLAPITRGP